MISHTDKEEVTKTESVLVVVVVCKTEEKESTPQINKRINLAKKLTRHVAEIMYLRQQHVALIFLLS